MTALRRYLLVGSLFGIVLLTCLVSKIPGRLGRAACVAKTSIEEVITKSSSDTSASFDAVTSASVMLDQSEAEGPKVGDYS